MQLLCFYLKNLFSTICLNIQNTQWFCFTRIVILTIQITQSRNRTKEMIQYSLYNELVNKVDANKYSIICCHKLALYRISYKVHCNTLCSHSTHVLVEVGHLYASNLCLHSLGISVPLVPPCHYLHQFSRYSMIHI